MENTFILELKKNSSRKIRFKHKIAARVIKFINSKNPFFKIYFKREILNENFGLKEKNSLDGPMSLEKAINIYHLLTIVLLKKISGDIVELGCYEGITSILIQKTLDKFKSNKILHVYDSFQGLPEKSDNEKEAYLKKGEFNTTKDILRYNFKKHKVRLPMIHEGWFKETLPTGLPKKISFAHLDSDFYSSMKESLEYIYPRLSKGAIVVIDDYYDPKLNKINGFRPLPGVKLACDLFFKNKKEKVNVLIAGMDSHGYFIKE